MIYDDVAKVPYTYAGTVSDALLQPTNDQGLEEDLLVIHLSFVLNLIDENCPHLFGEVRKWHPEMLFKYVV